jgi:imidazolonepropionase-like amidohydrolase
VYAFTAHRELTLLAHAGMANARVLDVATRATAEFLQLPDLGTLAAGTRADFIVLTANPLDDIANTQAIDAVYARGVALDRAALRAAWKK